MNASDNPLSGLWNPNGRLKGLFYGPDVVKTRLVSCLPTPSSKAFIITGSSLATKTPLVKQVEGLLLPGGQHAGTFSAIKEHAPVAQLDQATALVLADPSIDTVISIGGGSPIDSAKAISFRVHQAGNNFLHHIAIPTTLSAAECTSSGGYTTAEGVKTAVAAPELMPSYILYDPLFGRYTPRDLFASTGIRALDHAVELQYHPSATLITRNNALLALGELFDLLPKYHRHASHQAPSSGTSGTGDDADNDFDDLITRLFLAAFTSLGFLGLNMRGGLGLSHTLGYALGSPYGIPHGRTSCLTLGNVVKLKARNSPADAARIARILPFLPASTTSSTASSKADALAAAVRVGDSINRLVADLGFKTTLTALGVSRDQVDLIVARATGRRDAMPASQAGLTEEQKKLTAEVRQLVEGLY